MKIASGIALCAVFLLQTGCTEGRRKPEECWSQPVKDLAGSVARQIVIEHIENLVKAEGRPLTDEKKRQIDQSASVILSDFYVSGSAPEIKRLTCGAVVQFTYKRPDGKAIAAATSTEFDSVLGESGFAVSMPRAALTLLVNSATER